MQEGEAVAGHRGGEPGKRGLLGCREAGQEADWHIGLRVPLGSREVPELHARGQPGRRMLRVARTSSKRCAVSVAGWTGPRAGT
jgi:hypothetical protein